MGGPFSRVYFSKRKVGKTNYRQNRKGKVVEANCSKNLAYYSNGKAVEANCSKRMVGKTTTASTLSWAASHMGTTFFVEGVKNFFHVYMGQKWL